MRRRVRLTERDLNNIIRESVKRSLYTEGFFGKSKRQIQDDDDADMLENYAAYAQQVLEKNDPQAAFEFLQRFVEHYRQLKLSHRATYGTKNVRRGGYFDYPI